MLKKKIIFLLGPTGVGKTAVALSLAKKINAQIISCDSMQIYRKMDILTAKASVKQRKAIRHHLLNILDPDLEYNVAQYRTQALKICDRLYAQGKTPLFVGGTGLYYSVIVGGLTTLSYLYYTPVTAVVYDVVYGLVGMFVFIMVMDFMARHSVRGLEATSFALLCSINNLSGVASNVSGAYLLPMIGLKWLIVLSALTSFLCLFLINKIE